MGRIRQFTDRDYLIKVPGVNFNDTDQIRVSVEQKEIPIVDTTDVYVVGEEIIRLRISQEQSGALKTSMPAYLYVNWFSTGSRVGRGPLKIIVIPNQPKEIVEAGLGVANATPGSAENDETDSTEKCIDFEMEFVELNLKPEQTRTVTPTFEKQTVLPDKGCVFSSVTVESMPAPKLQSREVVPSEQTQNVRADAGFDGLDEVQVDPIPPEYVVPSGTKLITENVTGEDVTNYAAVNVAVPEYDDGGWGREVGAPNLDLLMLPGRELASGSGYNVIFCSFKIERKFPDGTFIRFYDGKPNTVKDVIINDDGTYSINEQVSYSNGYLYPSNLSVGWHVFRYEYTNNPAGVSYYANGVYDLGKAIYESYIHTPKYRYGAFGCHCKIIDSAPDTGRLEFSNNKLKKIDFVNCDFSNVTSLQDTFANAYSLQEVDLHGMDFSSVTTMQGMFSNGNSMLKIDMSGIKTRDLTNIGVSAAYCNSLQYADFRFDFCGGNFSMNLSYAVGTLLFDSDCQVGKISISCGDLRDLIGFPHANDNVNLTSTYNLTVESLMTVITQLNTVTETKTLTLGSDNFAKLTADQIAIAQDKGWTVVA